MRLMLADDHALVRAGIRALLAQIPGSEVVAETGDGLEALALIEKHRPDVALLDIAMPGLNGLEVAARIARISPRTRILVLSMHAGEGYVAQALRAGVAGYLLKDSAPDELAIALKSVVSGKTYLSPAISAQVVEGFLRSTSDSAPDPLASLTERQREILQLVAEGNSNKEIADRLGVTVKTVEAHRAQVTERLGIRDLPGLVRFAIRAGLISSED